MHRRMPGTRGQVQGTGPLHGSYHTSGWGTPDSPPSLRSSHICSTARRGHPPAASGPRLRPANQGWKNACGRKETKQRDFFPCDLDLRVSSMFSAKSPPAAPWQLQGEDEAGARSVRIPEARAGWQGQPPLCTRGPRPGRPVHPPQGPGPHPDALREQSPPTLSPGHWAKLLGQRAPPCHTSPPGTEA